MAYIRTCMQNLPLWANLVSTRIGTRLFSPISSRRNTLNSGDDLRTRPPRLADIEAARGRIEPYINRTPVLTSRTFDAWSGARLFLKAECFQRAGAFKYRGATNAVRLLGEEEARRGVATHSSGNHAAALALAARTRGIPAEIVMPSNSPAVKRAAVEGYGGRITFCAPALEAREKTLEEVIARTGAGAVHPYDDGRVIAGQGTAALELLEEVPDLDAVIAPVGGGGLLSGTAVAARGVRPGIRVLGSEPELADDAYRSLREGKRLPPCPPRTVADGLRTSLGELPFAILREEGVEIVLVSEEEILRATRALWERAKVVVEPSGAVPLAAILSKRVDLAGLKVGVILSGGNVDFPL
jgi:threonine dehydratase